MADPGLRQFLKSNRLAVLPAWPLDSWNFSDLTLAAWYFHPDLDVARARALTAAAGRITAGQRPNPTLSAAPGYNTTQSIPTPGFVTVSLDIPIETAGKRGYRIVRAEHLSAAARQDIATTAWRIRSQLRRALVELHVADERARQLDPELAAVAQIVRFGDDQVRAAPVSTYDVMRFRVTLERTRLNSLGVQSRRQEALAQVAGAVGIPSTALEAVSLFFEGLTSPPPDWNRLSLMPPQRFVDDHD